MINSVHLNLLFGHTPLRLHGCWLAALLSITAPLMQARAQDTSSYPNRPIRIVVPTAPGGPSDTVSRMTGHELTKRWGRQVVVDLRAGAGTIIGTEIVAKAAPDGYTLLAAPGAIALVNLMCTGAGGFIGPNVIGLLKQQTGGYAAGMLALSGGLVLSVVILVLLGKVMAARSRT